MNNSLTRRTLLGAVAPAVLGAATLASCSQQSDGSGGAPTDDGPATISFVYWDPNMTKAFEAAVAAFTKDNPTITVKPYQVPFDNYWTKLNTQIRSKSAPDVFWLQNIQFPLYATNGALYDITAMEAADPVSGVPDALMNGCKSNDKLMGLPWRLSTYGLYYNKKMFTAKGLELPTVDWTWDNVSQAAKELTDNANGTYGFGAECYLGSLYQTLYSNGVKVITENGTDTDFDSPESIKSLDFWADLCQEGYSPSIAQMSDTPASQWFTGGKIAMYITGSWNTVNYADILKADLGIVQSPKGVTDAQANALQINGISAATKYPSAAYKWARYLSSAEGQTVLNETAGAAAGVPANSAVNDIWLKAAKTPDAKIFFEEVPRTVPMPASKNSQAWMDKVPETLTPAWKGTKTTTEVAQEMAAIIRKLLKEE